MADEVRRMPVKTQRIELDGEYTGWWFTVRTNVPWSVLERMQKAEGQLSVVRETLGDVICGEWNFVDEAGNALPAPNAEVLLALPYDLLMTMTNRFNAALGTLPKA